MCRRGESNKTIQNLEILVECILLNWGRGSCDFLGHSSVFGTTYTAGKEVEIEFFFQSCHASFTSLHTLIRLVLTGISVICRYFNGMVWIGINSEMFPNSVWKQSLILQQVWKCYLSQQAGKTLIPANFSHCCSETCSNSVCALKRAVTLKEE